jgi:hypothetical protein
MKNTNSEKTNAQDNRGREDNATIKTDADEVSGSSDCSFSVLDRRPIRYDKETDTWSEPLPTRQELVGIGVEKIYEKLGPFVEAFLETGPDLDTLVPQCLPIDPTINRERI